MEFQISPLEGFEDIVFGMLPYEVRGHFDSKPTSFKRTPQDSFPCDYFESEGIFCYYDGGGRLEAVEFASPAQPTVENLKLLGLGLDEAVAALSSIDGNIKKEVDGAIAYRVGVSIFAPLAKENPKGRVESVLAFRPGYYN